jgi:hypothetical protein
MHSERGLPFVIFAVITDQLVCNKNPLRNEPLLSRVSVTILWLMNYAPENICKQAVVA